jgi:hypothetical protein
MAPLVKTHWRKAVVGLGLLFAVAGVVVLLWWVPQWQADDVVPKPDDPNARLTAENELRRTWVTAIAGAFVLVTGIVAWRNVVIAQKNLAIADQTLAVTREGQITERFTKAIEQLGATRDDGEKNLEIRLGGIYALERTLSTRSAGEWLTDTGRIGGRFGVGRDDGRRPNASAPHGGWLWDPLLAPLALVSAIPRRTHAATDVTSIRQGLRC